MRTIVPSVLALAICSVNLMAAPDDPKPAEPTAEQLAAAKKAYAKFGAEYDAYANPQTKQTNHIFRMPKKTTDADLKGLPDLPFRFVLDLTFTEVGDASIKELKELKNLARLDLTGAKVTDAGLQELKEVKNLTVLARGAIDFSEDFRNKRLQELKVRPSFPRAADFMKSEPEGLRISLPADKTPHKETGLSPQFALQGDFEIVAGYEFIQKDASKNATFEIYLATDSPNNEALALHRSFDSKGGGGFFITRLTTNADGNRETLPGLKTTTQLRQPANPGICESRATELKPFYPPKPAKSSRRCFASHWGLRMSFGSEWALIPAAPVL